MSPLLPSRTSGRARARCPISASGCRWPGLLSEHADMHRHPHAPAPHDQPDRPHRDRRQRRGHHLALDRARRHPPLRRRARAEPTRSSTARSRSSTSTSPATAATSTCRSRWPAPRSNWRCGSSSSTSSSARSSPTASSGLATGRATAGRAVGGAVGANPIPIIVPCHRVLGSDGRITGYSGGDGIPTKAWLLEHEGIAHTRPASASRAARRARTAIRARRQA